MQLSALPWCHHAHTDPVTLQYVPRAVSSTDAQHAPVVLQLQQCLWLPLLPGLVQAHTHMLQQTCSVYCNHFSPPPLLSSLPPPLPSPPLCSVQQSRFESSSMNRIQYLNNVTPGWLGERGPVLGGVPLLCSPLWHPGSDVCPFPPPLGEEYSPEELFAHGQEAFERALHLWGQSLQAATRDRSPLGSQIKAVLEQAQAVQHTSFGFR